MSYFFSNIAISIWAFLGWYFVGLGPTLVLIPQSLRREAFLLAPLIGLCLLTLTGLFEISILLVPLSPITNIAGLTLLSLFLCFFAYNRKKTLSEINEPTSRVNLIFIIAPLFLVIVFAWLFHKDGFQLLVGSSDQLQYCLNAKQILKMHTGSLADIPVPRYDHILQDIVTRYQPYDKTWRRGAEIMLATTKKFTGLSFQEAFPVTILCALITLILGLGSLGRAFFNLSIKACVILQITFLSSFCMLLLHVQGSLAMLLGFTPSFIFLALLSHELRTPSWQGLILTSIVLADSFATYPEPATVTQVLPTILLIIWQFRETWLNAVIAMRSVLFIYFLAYLLAPFSQASVFSNAQDIYHIISAMLHNTSSATTIHQFTFPDSMLQAWTLAPVVYGVASYYDGAAIIPKFLHSIAATPILGLVLLLTICSISLLGYLKNKKTLSSIFAILLFIWMTSSLLMSYKQDGFRFARSLHYGLPYALFGLVLLATSTHQFVSKKGKYFWLAATRFGTVFLIGFILTNIYTDWRSIRYISSHDVNTDPVVLRFDEKSNAWQNLKKELQKSAESQSPVLISGYKETIRPLAIASAIPEQSHVVGTSILSFWPVYNMQFRGRPHQFNTRLSVDELNRLQNQYHWSEHPELALIKHSEQAVVPTDHGFPEEWNDSKDVYPPLIRHFPCIGDVIYRKSYAVVLSPGMTSSLHKDNDGPFRMLNVSGMLKVLDHRNSPQNLVLVYEGNIGDIKLYQQHQVLKQHTLTINKLVKLTFTITPNEMNELNLQVFHPVKLRSISWG